MARVRAVGLPASNGGHTRHFGTCCLANHGIQIFIEARGFLVQHLATHLFGMLAVYCQFIQLTGSKYRGIDKFRNRSTAPHPPPPPPPPHPPPPPPPPPPPLPPPPRPPPRTPPAPPSPP